MLRIRTVLQGSLLRILHHPLTLYGLTSQVLQELVFGAAIKAPLETPASHIGVAEFPSRLCSQCKLPANAHTRRPSSWTLPSMWVSRTSSWPCCRDRHCTSDQFDYPDVQWPGLGWAQTQEFYPGQVLLTDTQLLNICPSMKLFF